MTNNVVSTAMLACTFGMAPSTLNATSAPTVLIGSLPAGTIADAIPGANIPPFGMCSTVTNPAVALTTAAALGVLTPAPCVPVTGAWIPTVPTVVVAGKPVLTADAKCMCVWGGQISVTMPGQFQTTSG